MRSFCTSIAIITAVIFDHMLCAVVLNARVMETLQEAEFLISKISLTQPEQDLVGEGEKRR